MSCRARERCDGRTRTFSNPFSGWSDRAVKCFRYMETQKLYWIRVSVETFALVQYFLSLWTFHCLHFWDIRLTCLGLLGGEMKLKFEIEPTTTRRWWTQTHLRRLTAFFSCIKQTWHDCCCLKSQASLLVSDPVWNWRTFFVTFEYFLIRFCVLLCNSREVRKKCQTFVRIEDCQLFDMEKVNLKLFRGSSFFVDKCKFWHKTRFTCCWRWWESAEMTFRLICADPPVFHRVDHLKFSFHWSRHRLICILKILRDHRKNVEKGVEGLKRATVRKDQTEPQDCRHFTAFTRLLLRPLISRVITIAHLSEMVKSEKSTRKNNQLHWRGAKECSEHKSRFYDLFLLAAAALRSEFS